MRIGVFSDVHSNLAALNEVVGEMERRGVERFVCLGDVVGYGGSPDECASLVRDIVDGAVLGNHDAAVSGRMDYSYYYDQAKMALDWTGEQLSEKNLSWLRSIPHSIDEDDIEVCFSHGSPVSPEDFDYIFSLEQAQETHAHRDSLQHVTFIGHSHLCRIFAFDEGGVVQLVPGRVELEEGRKYIISVGSVGQPRDYDPRAAFGIYDTEKKTYEQHRVTYDVALSARRIYQAGLPDAFGRRLFVGV